jgi:hypothetical protein
MCTAGAPAPPLNELPGAHLLGADGVPLRGTVQLADGLIRCDARGDDPVALSLLWDVPTCGALQLETTRVPLRPEPYSLHLELARHRLMRINLKREEWGLYDYPGMEAAAAEVDAARDQFVTALEADNPAAADAPAAGALALAIAASERVTKFHADVFLARRAQSNGYSGPLLGAAVPASLPEPGLAARLPAAFDFVQVPFTWSNIQPKEQETCYDTMDDWVNAARTAKLRMTGGPLLNFGVRSLPNWMYIWENDHDAVFEYAREHVQRTVKRYAKEIKSWIVCSGLHAADALALNFEHIIELTRMAATVTRKTSPGAQVIVDITQPWGEYFAHNQRTIPPLLYAEMVAQSGIPVDAFGVQLLFGLGSDGYHLRDFMQISSLLDRFANLGKPLRITGVSVPSAAQAGLAGAVAVGGSWHKPWSEKAQAEWLTTFCEVALSKPFVESVCIQHVADGLGDTFPAAGLFREDLEPKRAVAALGDLRRRLRSGAAT